MQALHKAAVRCGLCLFYEWFQKEKEKAKEWKGKKSIKCPDLAVMVLFPLLLVEVG